MRVERRVGQRLAPPVPGADVSVVTRGASAVTVGGAGGGSGSSICRLVLMVDSNSALARLNSRMARPSERPS